MAESLEELERLAMEAGLTEEDIRDAERSLKAGVQDVTMISGGGPQGEVAKIESLTSWQDYKGTDEWDQLLCWQWPPVGIDVFVEHPYYLGLKGQVYPKIMDLLMQAVSGKYVEVVISGAIGSGKSTCADLLLAYSVYELSCLRDPQQHYHLADGSPISVLMQSITEQKARKVLFTQISTLIRRSPYFEQKFRHDRNIKSALIFPRNIRLEPIAGTETAAIGENVLAAVLDESNFMPLVRGSTKIRGSTADVYDAAMENYHAISRRIRTRFMRKGVCPGRLIIVSQSRHPGDFTSRKMDEAKKDPTILAVQWAHWETNPSKFSTEKFRVAVASEATQQSVIVPDDEDPPEDMRVIEVPAEFLTDFERDMDGALRELAGICTRSVHPFLVRKEAVMAIVDKKRCHPFSRQQSTLRDGLRIIRHNFDMDVDSPRAAHLDLGVKNDACGLCIGYVSGVKRIERTAAELIQAEADDEQSHRVELDSEGKWVEMLPTIVIEAMLRIVPPPNDEIMLEDVVNLILRLKHKVGVPIKWVTADSFQSVAPLQMLKSRGLRTALVSVDKTDIPYNDLKAAIYDGRLQTYDYPPVMDELMALEKHEDAGRGRPKIDHPDTMMTLAGDRVPGRKDVADSCAGVVHLLVRRRSSWTMADDPTMERRSIGERVSMPRPEVFVVGKKKRGGGMEEMEKAVEEGKLGRVRLRTEKIII